MDKYDVDFFEIDMNFGILADCGWQVTDIQTLIRRRNNDRPTLSDRGLRTGHFEVVLHWRKQHRQIAADRFPRLMRQVDGQQFLTSDLHSMKNGFPRTIKKVRIATVRLGKVIVNHGLE